MRTLSSNAITKIAQQYGSEPVNIVGIFWNGVQELKYADKDVTGIDGKILELQELDEIIKVDSKSSNASITVTLDDTDGSIKSILDTTNVHKKKCIIYQYFTGLDLSDAFIVFVGEINTPIIWNEADRKVTLTILSQIESREVGFAPEEGQFANVNPEFIGKVWPLAFGEVLHVPATKVTEKLRGVTQSLIGIPDYTLPYKYWHLRERLEILQNGYRYYATAILLLKQIARLPGFIRNDYVNLILQEDPLKQRHEDLAEFIKKGDKTLEKLKKSLKDGTNIEKALAVEGNINSGLANPQIVTDLVEKQDYIIGLEDRLNSAKLEIRALTGNLKFIKGFKKLLETEAENAEYAFKNITAISKKIEKLSLDYIKTNNEIFKIVLIMQEHAKIAQNTVTVLNGDRFPQNQTIRISVNGLTYNGKFNGKNFTVDAVEPRYSNVQIAPRQDDQLDAFWITDANINLKGHFCLTSVVIGPGDPEYILQQAGYPISSIQNRIFKVIDQVGTKCIIELRELKPSIRVRRKVPHFPLLDDLPNDLWTGLQAAKEHTTRETQRILENSVEKYEKNNLARIRELAKKLKDIGSQANTDDDEESMQEALFSNIHEYNDLISNLKAYKEDVDKASEKISDHEFKILLKLENLRFRFVDQILYGEDTDVPITKPYYITGLNITNLQASSPVMLPAWFQFSPEGQELIQDATVITLPNGSRITADFLPESSLWFAEPGSEVQLVSDESEKYIANTLASSIKSVYAYKAVNGIRQLVPIPRNYYSKSENDPYLPLTCTSITLKKPLKDYPGEDWEDGVYVSMESTVGPNTADIIEWLFENYTNISIDASTFADIATKLDKYPSSFALFDKKNVLQLIDEIAWQARCSVTVKNGIAYIKYMSEEPTSIETITEDDIIFGSLELEFTRTEDLVTKFVANWLPDYSRKDNKKNQIILRYNVSIYQEVEKQYEFYIYNIESLVNKSATFWLIRNSNIWKQIKFRTPLTKLKAETGDCVLLDLANTYFSSSDVKAIVEKATYDSNNHTIDFECWLPIRLGEMTPYVFSWPANLTINTLYPSVDEINAGYAGSPHSSVPKNLSYRILPNVDIIEQLELRPKDYGEAFPSDANSLVQVSPLQGLSEEDYIVIKPSAYQTPETPRLSDTTGQATYQSPVIRAGSELSEGDILRSGRVIGIINNHYGIYQVQTGNGDVFQVTGDLVIEEETDLLEEGNIVIFSLDEASNEYHIISAQAESGTKEKYFIITQEFDDYLICKTFKYSDSGYGHGDDFDADTKDILVAKPRLLQASPFNGRTIDYGSGFNITYIYTSLSLRTAIDSLAQTEQQIIVPPYFIGDILTARRGPTGYEGITWTDRNEAGRAWATI